MENGISIQIQSKIGLIYKQIIMENKINIAEILKDCPKGTKLYSPLCGECRVIKVYNYLGFDVINGTDDVFNFSYDGRYNLMGECCIFPSKDQRDWSKFELPYEFKDGDIVTWGERRSSLVACIYKERKNTISFNHHIALYKGGLGIIVNGEIILTNDKLSLATEEEKTKLFQTIKDNGYKWNAETKTLEKLIEPNFKVGDTIQDNGYEVEITKVNVEDELYEYKSINTKTIGSIAFSKQDYWELVSNKFDITTLVPFESRVLMRSSNAREWVGTFYSHYSDNKFYGCGMCCDQCIPYEKNEHLLGTTDDCDEFYKNWE